MSYYIFLCVLLLAMFTSLNLANIFHWIHIVAYLVLLLFIFSLLTKRRRYKLIIKNNNLSIGSNKITLPETERVLIERGYTGIMQYLYTGYAELMKLLFLSTEYFAALHDNFDDGQFQARVTKTRIVKTIIVVFVTATVVTVAIALPWPITGFVTAVSNIAILVAVAVSATVVFGITVHAFNNMIEDMCSQKQAIIFSGLTEEYIDSKIDEHKSLPVRSLLEDIKIMLSHSDEITSLFDNPVLYENGIRLKSKMQKIMELYYLDTLLARNNEDKELLLGLFYKTYSGIDSAILQELLIRDIMTTFFKANKVSNLQIEILNFFFTVNDKIFVSRYNDSDNLSRIKNQSDISYMFLLIAEASAAPDSKTIYLSAFTDSKKYGALSKQIFLSEYIDVFHEVPIDYFQKTLDAESIAVIENLYKDNYNLSGLLKDMYVRDIPSHIGVLFIKANGNLYEVYDILSDKTYPVEYRLYALAVLSKMDYDSKEFKSFLTTERSFIGKRIKDSPDYGKQLIDNELAAALAEKSRAFLDNLAKSKKADSGNDFLNVVETEKTYAALAVIARNDDENIDPVDLLKRLAYVFCQKLNVEVAIKVGNNAEIFNVPLKSGREFVCAIEKIVSKVTIVISNSAKNAGNEYK